jgi:hypothetical protein
MTASLAATLLVHFTIERRFYQRRPAPA